MNMGIFEKLFGKKEVVNEPVTSLEEEAERGRLIDQCCNLVEKILKVNSFDSSITYYRSDPYRSFSKKTLPELKVIKSTLEGRLNKLQNPQRDPQQEAIERAKWTGERSHGLSDRDLDRTQRDGWDR